MQRYDEPFLPFGKDLIAATRDLVAGYVFDLEAYLVPGAAGIIALERTISYVPSDLVTVLHGTFVTPAIISMPYLPMNVDSITLGQHHLIDAQPSELRSRLLVTGEDLPDTGYSTFSAADHEIVVRSDDGRSVRLRIAGAEVTQAGMGENFAEVAATTLREFSRAGNG